MCINKIGNLFKQERIKINMSLETLSKLSNISISTLSNIENNKIRKLKSVYIYRICNILKLNYENVLRLKWEIFPTFFYERNNYIASK